MLGKVDAAAAILEVCNKEASRRELENKTIVPARQLDEYLTMLVSKKLITTIRSGIDKKDSEAIIRITKRGIQFLDLYKSMNIRYLTVSAR
jgi:predicted transcriptional regulator